MLELKKGGYAVDAARIGFERAFILQVYDMLLAAVTSG